MVAWEEYLASCLRSPEPGDSPEPGGSPGPEGSQGSTWATLRDTLDTGGDVVSGCFVTRVVKPFPGRQKISLCSVAIPICATDYWIHENDEDRKSNCGCEMKVETVQN